MNYLLLQIANQDSAIPQYVLMAGIAAVFYLFMIRPQQKRQRQQRQLLNTLKKGTSVTTIGGIHGKVHAVEEMIVVLEIDGKGTKLTVSKSAIAPDSLVRKASSKQ